MAGTYDALSGLPLEIDDYGLEGLAVTVSSGFERLSTLIRLRGGREEGVGEDIASGGYDALDPAPGLPADPLSPSLEPTGLRWATSS